jgi:hypothetical protein
LRGWIFIILLAMGFFAWFFYNLFRT